MTSSLQNATRILLDLGGRDSSASAKLLPIVYDELHRLAVAYMRRQNPNHTLQPTALVHEAYLKLVDQTRVGEQDRTHFLAVAATALRNSVYSSAVTSYLPMLYVYATPP